MGRRARIAGPHARRAGRRVLSPRRRCGISGAPVQHVDRDAAPADRCAELHLDARRSRHRTVPPPAHRRREPGVHKEPDLLPAPVGGYADAPPDRRQYSRRVSGARRAARGRHDRLCRANRALRRCRRRDAVHGRRGAGRGSARPAAGHLLLLRDRRAGRLRRGAPPAGRRRAALPRDRGEVALDLRRRAHAARDLSRRRRRTSACSPARSTGTRCRGSTR